MDNKLLLIAIIGINLIGVLNAATVTVNNSSNTFTPDEISINQGDTVKFSIGGIHNVVEVSQQTWEANEATSNGGFTLDFGGGVLVFNTPGTYYYVCEPHASVGMKGIIEVSPISALPGIGKSREIFLNAYPNPISEQLSLEFSIAEPTTLHIELFDITGRRVRNLINNEYSAGNHTETIDLRDLKPGKYFIHYQTKSGSEVKSLLKLE